jgi:hypothetical protein
MCEIVVIIVLDYFLLTAFAIHTEIQINEAGLMHKTLIKLAL